MGIRQIVKAEKTVFDQGTWNTGLKMPKTAFPLGKSRHFHVRAPYAWRIVKFRCDGIEYRLLIFYRTDLSKYSAYLGRVESSDTALLARYEYDVMHGWHVHTDCSGVGLTLGRTGGLPDRVPNAKSRHRRTVFGIDSQDKALLVGMKFFGVLAKDDLFA
jgi:hypothetical protein